MNEQFFFQENCMTMLKWHWYLLSDEVLITNECIIIGNF